MVHLNLLCRFRKGSDADEDVHRRERHEYRIEQETERRLEFRVERRLALPVSVQGHGSTEASPGRIQRPEKLSKPRKRLSMPTGVSNSQDFIFWFEIDFFGTKTAAVSTGSPSEFDFE